MISGRFGTKPTMRPRNMKRSRPEYRNFSKDKKLKKALGNTESRDQIEVEGNLKLKSNPKVSGVEFLFDKEKIIGSKYYEELEAKTVEKNYCKEKQIMKFYHGLRQKNGDSQN